MKKSKIKIDVYWFLLFTFPLFTCYQIQNKKVKNQN